MSRRQDTTLDPERRLYALVLILAFMLAAVASTGCAGINFRHMTVDGVTLPDALYTQFRRVAEAELIAKFDVDYHDHLIPPVTDVPQAYSRQRAFRQARELALWSIDHGYECEIQFLHRRGWAAHPVLMVRLDGKDVIFDPAMHRMYIKPGKWKVLPFKMDEDAITHKGILDIGRQLNPANTL